MRWTEQQTFFRRNFDMLDRLEMNRLEAKPGETWHAFKWTQRVPEDCSNDGLDGLDGLDGMME
jgi:hypothetical protein